MGCTPSSLILLLVNLSCYFFLYLLLIQQSTQCLLYSHLLRMHTRCVTFIFLDTDLLHEATVQLIWSGMWVTDNIKYAIRAQFQRLCEACPSYYPKRKGTCNRFETGCLLVPPKSQDPNVVAPF